MLYLHHFGQSVVFNAHNSHVKNSASCIRIFLSPSCHGDANRWLLIMKILASTCMHNCPAQQMQFRCIPRGKQGWLLLQNPNVGEPRSTPCSCFRSAISVHPSPCHRERCDSVRRIASPPPRNPPHRDCPRIPTDPPLQTVK